MELLKDIIAIVFQILIVGGIIACLPYVFKWLREKSNNIELLNETEIDDKILSALEIGIKNSSEVILKKLENELENELDKIDIEEAKENAKIFAIEKAKEILSARGINLSEFVSPAVLDTFITFLVDQLKKDDELSHTIDNLKTEGKIKKQ